jgi:filamentous hemagglutinin family protein
MNKKTTFLSISVALFTLPCGADIHTDGTAGRAVHLQGPHFQIGQDLGTLKGNNLFHSFGHFNLNKSQSATFTGNSNIKNVISRVTGGDASKIDGTLRSTIGKANFYFINPAGVVFGKNAHVDVPAAFYTSTAAELKFADGGKFSAVHPNAKLSMAAPEAFGFLGKQTGTIAVNGSQLDFKTGAVVQLSANKISMDNAAISGKEMDLQLAAVGAAKQAVDVKTLPNRALQGDITLKNTRLTTEGNGKGRIAIRGGQVGFSGGGATVTNIGNKNMTEGQGIDVKTNGLCIKGSEIKTKSNGYGNGGKIIINTKGSLILTNDGNIRTETYSKGNSGTINIISNSIKIHGNQPIDKTGEIIRYLVEIPPKTGIYSISYAKSSGRSGDINITSKNSLVVVKDGSIFTNTMSKGDAGNINVKSGSIRLEGYKLKGKFTPDFQDRASSGIFSEANFQSSGKAGEVKVTATNELTMLHSAVISSVALENGDANNVEVRAGKIIIDGKGSNLLTGIFSNNIYSDSGKAGTVNIFSKNELKLINGGIISSIAYSNGYADNININAGNILIDGQGDREGLPFGVFIFGKIQENNNISSVNIEAKNNITLAHGGMITSSLNNQGSNYDINIKSGSLSIDGYDSNSTAIFISAAPFGEKVAKLKISVKNKLLLTNGGMIYSGFPQDGNAGDIEIKAGLLLINGGKEICCTGISASTENTTSDPKNIRSGKIDITAKKIIINNGNIENRINYLFEKKTIIKKSPITINSPYIELNNGLIGTSIVGSATANSIIINTKKLKLDSQSKISTTAKSGNGGSITIKGMDKKQNVDWIHLHNSRITTSVTGDGGNGGDININADALVMDNGFIQANTDAKNGSGGTIDLKNIKNLIASGGNLQIGGTKPSEFEPNSGNNIIQAAAPSGISGNITNNSPQLNLAGALVNLKTTQPDLNRAGRDPCSSIVRQSTIKKGGKGGVPVFHKGRDGLAIDSLLDTPSPKQAQTTQPSHMAANQDCQPKHPRPQQHTLAHNAE